MWSETPSRDTSSCFESLSGVPCLRLGPHRALSASTDRGGGGGGGGGYFGGGGGQSTSFGYASAAAAHPADHSGYVQRSATSFSAGYSRPGIDRLRTGSEAGGHAGAGGGMGHGAELARLHAELREAHLEIDRLHAALAAADQVRRATPPAPYSRRKQNKDPKPQQSDGHLIALDSDAAPEGCIGAPRGNDFVFAPLGAGGCCS